MHRNYTQVRELTTNNILVMEKLPGDLTERSSTIVDLNREPIVAVSFYSIHILCNTHFLLQYTLSRLYPTPMPDANHDHVFIHCLSLLGTMNSYNSAKVGFQLLYLKILFIKIQGDLGDTAFAWALWRIANSGSSLGDFLGLPDGLLSQARLHPNLKIGSFDDFGAPKGDFTQALSDDRYVHPDNEAGPDGVVGLFSLDLSTKIGIGAIQSKVQSELAGIKKGQREEKGKKGEKRGEKGRK